MMLRTSSKLRFGMAPVALFILILSPSLAHGQTASEFVDKANAARSNLDFESAFDNADKAVAADSMLWTAYVARAENRYYRDKKRGIGYENETDKGEWHKMLDDYLKAAELSGQNYEVYNKLDIFMIFMLEKGPPEKPEVKLFNELNRKARAFYSSQILANPNHTCAQAALARFEDFGVRRKALQAAIDKFDGTNGRKCSAEAAASMTQQLISKGDIEEAKTYYKLSLQIDSTTSYMLVDLEALGINTNTVSAVSQSPKPTPVAETRPTPTPISAAEAEQQAKLDEFFKDVNRMRDEVDALIADAKDAMKKLLKASQEDLKYGTSTVNLYTGTRRRAQTQLDTIHKKYRDLIRKYESSIPSTFINELKKLDRSLPETVD